MVDAEQDALCLLSRLVQASSPNPPGDTRAAAAVLADGSLRAGSLSGCRPRCDHAEFARQLPGRPPGPHLVLNGHIDTFPAVAAVQWTRDPFGGEVADGAFGARDPAT